MTEQIEVFGQFDVRRDLEPTVSEVTGHMTIDNVRITNTFAGDQLSAALDAVKNKKNMLDVTRISQRSFISVEKILL